MDTKGRGKNKKGYWSDRSRDSKLGDGKSRTLAEQTFCCPLVAKPGWCISGLSDWMM